MTVKTVPSLLRFGAGVVLRGVLVGLACGLTVFLLLQIVRSYYGSWAPLAEDEEAGLFLAALVIYALVGIILGAVLSVVAFFVHLILRATRLRRTTQNIMLYITLIVAAVPAWFLFPWVLFGAADPFIDPLQYLHFYYVELVLIVFSTAVGAFVVIRYMNRQYAKAGNVATAAQKT